MNKKMNKKGKNRRSIWCILGFHDWTVPSHGVVVCQRDNCTASGITIGNM